MNRWVARGVLAATLAALATLSGTTLHYIGEQADAFDPYEVPSERVIAYRATRDGGPRFRLQGERVLRLESYAMWPDGPFDPAREVLYGLDVRIRVGPEEIWRQTIYTESRQSKERVAGKVVAEAVVSVDDEREFGDQRITTLDLPPVPWGADLSVRATGEVPEVLVRVFARGERGRSDQARLARTIDAAEAAALTAPITYVPWALEDASERLQLLRVRYERLSALGERGVDYDIRRIDLSRLRGRYRAPGGARGFLVTPEQAAVVNLRGPMDFAVAGDAIDGGDRPTIRIDAVSEGAPMTPVTLTPIPGRSQRVHLPFGIHSVRFTTDRAAQIVARGPPDQAIRPGTTVELGGFAVYLPDRVRFPVAGTGPGRLPLVVDLGGAPLERGELSGQVVRLDSRAVSSRPTVAAACTATLAFRAADGRVLARRTVSFAAATTGFEIVGDVGPAPAGRPEADPGVEPRAADGYVTDPVASRFLAPPGTSRLELTSQDLCVHRLYRFYPGTVELERPYRDQPLATLRYRYPRLARRVWFPMEPSNATELRAAGQLETLSAQVRLEPPDDDEAVAAVRSAAADGAAVLVPDGTPEQQRIREPVAADRRGEVATRWPPGSLTPLAGGVDLRFVQGASPRLYFRAPDAAIGGEIALSLDGAPWLRATLPSRTGNLRLDDPPAGRHRIAARVPPGVALWIDRPPARAGAPIERMRTVYALADEPLRVRVRQRAGEHIVVNAVVYAPRTGRAALDVRIDGGRPRRRTGEQLGRLTEAERRVELPPAEGGAAAVLVDVGERPAGYARVVSIGLMDDLVGGSHAIELRRVAGGPMWARFFVSRIERPADEVVTQSRSRAGDEVTVAP